MARVLFAEPADPRTAAQMASLRARVAELEAEVAHLRAAALADLDEELRQVSESRAALT